MAGPAPVSLWDEQLLSAGQDIAGLFLPWLAADFILEGVQVGNKQKRPERGVFAMVLAEKAGFEPAVGY